MRKCKRVRIKFLSINILIRLIKKPDENKFSIQEKEISFISNINEVSPIDFKNYFENQVFIGENKVNLLNFN